MYGCYAVIQASLHGAIPKLHAGCKSLQFLYGLPKPFIAAVCFRKLGERLGYIVAQRFEAGFAAQRV